MENPERQRAGGNAAVREQCRACSKSLLVPAEIVRGFSFLECTNCGFVFAPDITGEIALRYADGYHGADDGAPAIGWASTEFLEPALARLPDEPLTILDHGCGESVIPAALRDQGHRVVGIDIAPPSRPDPDRRIGAVEKTSFGGLRFDLVYSFQVFEHLPEPRPVFERLLDLTRPGGLLLIHTDMETPERAGGLADWWYASPPDHCASYRPRTFEEMLPAEAGELEWADEKAVLIRRCTAV